MSTHEQTLQYLANSIAKTTDIYGSLGTAQASIVEMVGFIEQAIGNTPAVNAVRGPSSAATNALNAASAAVAELQAAVTSLHTSFQSAGG